MHPFASFKARLTTLAVLCLVCCVAGAAVAGTGVGRIGAALARAAVDEQAVRDLGTVRGQVADLASGTMALLTGAPGGDGTGRAASESALAETLASLDAAAAQLPAAERAAVAEVAGTVATWLEHDTRVRADPPADATALAAAVTDCRALAAEVGLAVDAATTAVEARFVADQGEARTLSTTIRDAVVLLATATGLGLAGYLLRFTRSLLRRLRAVDAALGQLAGGDLTARCRLDGDDELGHMGRAFDAAVARLADALGAISGAGRAVHDAVAHLHEVAGRASTAAGRTAEQIADLEHGAAEVSRTVADVAAGAGRLGASIREISGHAGEAAQVADGALATVHGTREGMQRLAGSSREIGDVVRLITGIAEQTNLLALNATIESARAGSAGRGFAIVAEEVKQLARETARATDDISRRVAGIQDDAGRAGASIGQVAEVIARIDDLQGGISGAVAAQTEATGAIDDGVGQAAAGTARIAATVADVARAGRAAAEVAGEAERSATVLDALSRDLATALDRFRF